MMRIRPKVKALLPKIKEAIISGGNEADISLAEEPTECLPEDSTLVGDKACDKLAETFLGIVCLAIVLTFRLT